MNDDEKFKQRWEFRRKEDDPDSSSDDDGGGGGLTSHSTDPKVIKNQVKLYSDLIVLNDDESDDINHVIPNVPEKEIKKTRPSRKKNDSTQKKKSVRSSNKKVSNKENTKSRKKKEPVLPKPKKTQVENKCSKTRMVIPNELSAFCDSMIRDLLVARVNMFAKMREEMEKLTDVGPCLEQKKKRNTKPSQKAKVSNGDRPKTSTKPRSQSKKRKLETDAVSGLNVSHSRGGVSINNNLEPRTDHPNLSTEINAFRCVFPSFSEINGKGENFIGQNNFQMTSPGIGFTTPIRQILENASAISSLTYSENSVKHNSNGGPRMEFVGYESVIFQTE